MSEFGKPVRPHKQRCLAGVKHRPHHRYWLCLAVQDSGGYVTACEMSPRGTLTRLDGSEVESWPELWRTIEDLDIPRGQWWAVGWRVRYALDRAGLVAALESGEISLPRPSGKKSERPFSGSQTLTSERVSFDVCVGAYRVKFVELTQLGVMQDQWQVPAGGIAVNDVERAVADYCRACSVVGLSASRTSAAQVGYARMRSHHIAACVAVNLDDESRAQERRAYFGGRNEAFRLGDIPGITYSLDIRGCYAHICQSQPLPTYQIETYPNGLSVDRVSSSSVDHWIVDCVVRTDTADYPLRWGGNPIYPTGVFWTSLCWPELKHALERGRVEKITRAARYKAAPWLSSYGKWFQASKANLISAGLAHVVPTLKCTFNASLGYTARRRYDWTPWKVGIRYPWWIGKTNDPDGSHAAVQAHVFDSHAEWMRVNGEPYDAIPYLHATICSYARVNLLDVFGAGGREHIHYCDTDGILCDAQANERLRSLHRLWGCHPGQLVERFAPGSCTIYGQKNYRIGSNTIHAGSITTRRSVTQAKTVLDTPTGRCGPDGVVEPFEFWCRDEGDGEMRYVNYLKGFDNGEA